MFTITFIAKNSILFSLRDLHKQLDYINNISLKTTIDYIDFSIQAKIIKRCYKYDIKNNKEISSKAKYYFNDT
jgi:predicted AAA+ superfamily ATPase